MKITSFNPIIITKDAEPVLQLFEGLGFEKRHIKEGIEVTDSDTTVIRMKDENGYYLDVTQTGSKPGDAEGIRMNVDDFEEAYDILLSHGFKNEEDCIFITPSSRFALMTAPSGFLVNLCKHMKVNLK